MATFPTKNSSHCPVYQWLDGDRKKEARSSRLLLETGSMMSRLPSRLMMASLPGNSNSTGIRIAWLRLLRNSRTWRGAGLDWGTALLLAYTPTYVYPDAVQGGPWSLRRILIGAVSLFRRDPTPTREKDGYRVSMSILAVRYQLRVGPEHILAS